MTSTALLSSRVSRHRWWTVAEQGRDGVGQWQPIGQPKRVNIQVEIEGTVTEADEKDPRRQVFEYQREGFQRALHDSMRELHIRAVPDANWQDHSRDWVSQGPVDDLLCNERVFRDDDLLAVPIDYGRRTDAHA